MSAIWHDSGLPSFLAPRVAFSFYDQAQVEQPAPVSYQIAQEYRQFVQQPLGASFHWEVARRAHEVWLIKRPWWISVV